MNMITMKSITTVVKIMWRPRYHDGEHENHGEEYVKSTETVERACEEGGAMMTSMWRGWYHDEENKNYGKEYVKNMENVKR